jgi:predicted ester cyclase
VAATHGAFSGLRVEILHCVWAGDLVATHTMFRGRHTGPWLGVLPSGNQVEFRVRELLRYRGGRWAEHWAVADVLGLQRQVGAFSQFKRPG